MEKHTATFDFKVAYADLYRPRTTPAVIRVPAIRFAAVRGKGDPNEPDGAYQKALEMLYTLSYTIRMAPKAALQIPGYFPYVVPPLEGFWSSESIPDGRRAKQKLEWLSCIRLPDFVTPEIFGMVRTAAEEKKRTDLGAVQFLTVTEGECVQCMHIGPYDDEPATFQRMEAFLAENGLEKRPPSPWHHHEIYVSDPRRTAPQKLKTVLRMEVKPSLPA